MHQENNDTLNILYRDQQLLIINKPAGLLSVPAKNPQIANCLDQIKQDYPTVSVVHRLDEPTSGILIFSLTKETEKHLQKQFREHQVIKEYIAVVEGQIAKSLHSISIPICVDWPNRPRQKVCYQSGKPALTRLHLLRHDKTSSRLQLLPQSGRTHQLRLHLYQIGHPIIGDSLYPGKYQANRLLLHAHRIQFCHPLLNTQLSIMAPCPF